MNTMGCVRPSPTPGRPTGADSPSISNSSARAGSVRSSDYRPELAKLTGKPFKPPLDLLAPSSARALFQERMDFNEGHLGANRP